MNEKFTVLLSPTPRAARLARLLTAEHLRIWGHPCLLDPAEHIVAELAANAVTHARVPGRDFRLGLYVTEGAVRIEVTDTRGDRMPQVCCGEGESGRGLILVEALADRWGVDEGPAPRKTVRAELDLVRPAPGNPNSGAPDANPKDTSLRGKEPDQAHPALRAGGVHSHR
ncbi:MULTISPECIES: ATP-binding protein [unclassified Streptomyces]|uniref:ATP-binding protein n=1 Tax=unclassified Streptomyces TaxID=2593676 RepID=UPI000DB9CE1E|nr:MULTISPECIES: ATP-binding protein [unclassified Streptomyces]MYT69997.1 ATP-binding protein [Streptomyces sp. SID8367]RAJ88573.1 histidine kinase-like protein [Streptomyces sp. PsTaAH-137]